MPIYQYRCVECGHQLEALQKMSDDRLVDCPECNQPALKKQVTAAAFKLNGTGWYETDFKNSGKPAAPKSTESSSDSAASDKSSSTSATCSSNSGAAAEAS